LALLTLVVFGAMRERGPETPIQRFHEALRNNSTPDALRQLVAPVSGDEFQPLAGQALMMMSQGGGNVVVRKTVYEGTTAYVVVEYGTPPRNPQLIWVVTRTPRSGWQINAFQTLLRWRSF